MNNGKERNQPGKADNESGRDEPAGTAEELVLTGGLMGAANALASSSGSPVAQTRCGKVRGVETGGICIFMGIPYGGPTEGARRFMPPQKPEKWSGIRDATQPGPRCIQARSNLFDTPIRPLRQD